MQGFRLRTLLESRNASTLVVAEHNGEKLTPITLNAVTAAARVGGEVAALIAGENCGPVSNRLVKLYS